jgi:ATP-binding protein involved in chromosome partitioning
MVTEQEIRQALAGLPPGVLTGVRVLHGQVTLILEGEPRALERLKVSIEGTVAALPGVEGVNIVITSEKQAERPALPEVRRVIAVGSGKGGVGKSTTALNLALAAAKTGLKVGLLDADVFGPSLPTLAALYEKPIQTADKYILPLEKFGLTLMSIGFLVPPDEPIVWRGLMVQTAIKQMLCDVAWGPLDVLFIDLPPGTGDVQLTLAQKARLSGAVVVSTPQDLALADVKRSIAMFQKVNVPVLGMIENMSSFICPHCGEMSDIFGHGGAKAEAERLGVPFLGAVPLDIKLREASDAGTPLMVNAPESVIGKGYQEMAKTIIQAVIPA